MTKKKEKSIENEVPVIDMTDKHFQDKFNFAMWSTFSSSDYRNDRERPYNGQSHTDYGKRGETLVQGLTMRDISDCMVQGFLAASNNEDLQKKVFEIHKEFQGTEYASKGNWRYQDIYKIDLSEIDPGAVIKNTICFIEYYMGIFPNVSEEDIQEALREIFKDESNEDDI